MEDVVKHFEVTDSTMDRARELSTAETQDQWLLVHADTQEKGRGSSGRTWSSPAGNVYMTPCIPKKVVEKRGGGVGLMPLEVGLCVHRVLSAMVPDGDFRVKWPNDVLVKGEKISGNIIEDGPFHYLVGVGVNVKVAPELPPQQRRATCLECHAGKECSVERVTRGVFSALKERFQAPLDVVELLREYSSHVDWSAPVHKRMGDGSKGPAARALGITDAGHLRIQLEETGEEEVLVAQYLF